MQNQTTQVADATTLVHRYLPLVRHAVVQVAGRLPGNLRHEDLLTAGLLGLIEGARTASTMSDFTPIATSWIRQALLDEVRDVAWPHRRLPTLGPEAAAVSERLGQSARTVHIANEMSIDQGVLRSLTDEASHTPAGGIDRRGASHGDALAQLPDSVRRVLVALFFDGRSITDVAGELEMSETQVGELRSKGLSLLRGEHKAEELLPPEQRPSRALSPSYYAAAGMAADSHAVRAAAADEVADCTALSAFTG